MDDMRASKFIYVDTETGGLDARNNPLLEVSYAVGNSEPVTFYPDLYEDWREDVDPKALEVNKWDERFPDNSYPNKVVEALDTEPWLATDAHMWREFMHAAQGKTIVGLNIDFDAQFILNNNNVFGPNRAFPTPWKHRLFSLGPWFQGLLVADISNEVRDNCAFDTDLPISGNNIHEIIRLMRELNGMDDNFPKGDHTAAQDVIATRYYHQYGEWFFTGGVAPKI